MEAAVPLPWMPPPESSLEPPVIVKPSNRAVCSVPAKVMTELSRWAAMGERVSRLAEESLDQRAALVGLKRSRVADGDHGGGDGVEGILAVVEKDFRPADESDALQSNDFLRSIGREMEIDDAPAR